MSTPDDYLEYGPDSGEELVTRHAELVKRIAYHMVGRMPASVDVEDLIQAGMVGLLLAQQSYSPDKGANFETYAGIRIRGAMLDEVRKSDWTPRSVHRKAREVAAAIRAIESRTGGQAQDPDIARELGISLDEYHKILRDSVASKLFSIDNPPGESEGPQEVLSPSAGPDELLEDEDVWGHVTRFIEELPERERLVMSLYYNDELNLREIGEVLDVSESRVCQIHAKALMRIRVKLQEIGM